MRERAENTPPDIAMRESGKKTKKQTVMEK